MSADLVDILKDLLIDFIAFLPRLIVAIITFVGTLLAVGPVTRIVRNAAQRKIESQETVLLLTCLVKWTIVVMGFIIALGQVDFDITGFIAGLGIAGLTIGFALQEIARNFTAGLLIFVRQPFRIGDEVKIASYTGSVEEITTRDTMLCTFDGEQIILPNVDVLGNPIINYSAHTQRRRTIHIGLGYGQDADHARTVFIETLKSVEGVLVDPEPTVYAEELGDSAMILAARFWIDTKDNNLLQVHSNAVVALNAAAERDGIELPYPIQTVRVAQTA